MIRQWTAMLSKVRDLFQWNVDTATSPLRTAGRDELPVHAVAAYDVFVSYASEDRAKVTALVAELRSRGLSIFFDDEQLRAGQQFDVLHQQICRCSSFVVVVSTAALASAWVRDETNTAVAAANKEIPLTIVAARLDPASELPPHLMSRKAVDIFEPNWASGIDFLVATLCGKEIGATPLGQFRAFIESLPIVDEDLASKLDTTRKVGSFLSPRRKSEVLSWLRHADAELLALASWLFDVTYQRKTSGRPVLQLAERWASSGDNPRADQRATRLHAKRLLQRAVDSGLLVPWDNARYDAEVPSDEMDRWFDVDLFEVCRAAYLFDVHVHDPELNGNPPFRAGQLQRRS